MAEEIENGDHPEKIKRLAGILRTSVVWAAHPKKNQWEKMTVVDDNLMNQIVSNVRNLVQVSLAI